MIKKLRKIALGTVAIAAVIALFATGPEVAQVWIQAANAMVPDQPRTSLDVITPRKSLKQWQNS